MGKRLVTRQLADIFITNRKNSKPFDLHLCNFHSDRTTVELLTNRIPKFFNLPIEVHTECFTEIFPTERLVYLTPDSEEYLQEFNPNDIYVIGSISNMLDSNGKILAEAKKKGIRTARLPLEKFLKWKQTGKALTPTEIVNILLDVRQTGDWRTAFKHIKSFRFSLKN